MPDPSAESSIARLATGTFLVARPLLRDPNFEGCVLFLCAHEPDGDYGLILNRAASMPLEEVFDQLPPSARGPRRIGIGGPVEQDKVQILDWSQDPAPHGQLVVPGLTMGGHWDFSAVPDPASDNPGKPFLEADPSTYRIFIGYSGWGEEQLRNEIELGAWDVFEADILSTLKLPPESVPSTSEGFLEWALNHPPKPVG
jgi:putative transcriptional regulator